MRSWEKLIPSARVATGSCGSKDRVKAFYETSRDNIVDSFSARIFLARDDGVVMVTDKQVLTFFRDALSLRVTWLFKPIQVELDTPLQSYAEWDELPCAIEDFRIKFSVDTSVIDYDRYYPWKNEKTSIKIFKRRARLTQTRPLTIRMFAESARAGKWLFD